MKRTRALLAALAAAVLAGTAAAAPYTPAEDGEVLERLPASWKTLRPAAARANDANADPRPAEAQARRLIEAFRAEGDPRYLGQAHARLEPWISMAAPPIEVRLLRAIIRQSTHEFDAALADLDAVLEAQPRHAQARLTRATVLAVRGRAAESQADCLRLAGRAEDLVVVACATQAASLAGEAAASHRALAEALAASRSAPGAQRLWALTLAAEISARLGRHADAEREFRAAMALGIADPYLVAAYSDWLIDRGRPRVVLGLVAADERNDNLLLRRALAEKSLGLAGAERTAAVLRERMEALRSRGDRSHAREEARLALAFDAKPDRALAAARENWAQQREPADARVLVQAALAAGDAASLREALDWMRATRLEDAAIESLLTRTPA